MSKGLALIAALIAAALALPAAARWPQYSVPSQKSTAPAPSTATAPENVAMVTGTPSTAKDFEYIGGDGGWQLTQHHYIVVNGRFEHASDCDHTMRTASRPIPGEFDGAQYPGA